MTIEAKKRVSQALAKSQKKGTLAGLKHTDVQTVLEGMKLQIAQALPKHLTADRMIHMAATLISKNPKLGECTAQSLVGAVMQASILGFKPVDSLGQCYFVPYNANKGTRQSPKWVKEVQFQIGYKGYIDLARRSGQIKTLYAYPVRQGDQFSYELGLNPDIKHVPGATADAQITHVYAVAHYKDGGYNFIVLTRDEVEKLRLRNPHQKAAPSQAWATDYEAMACAKAIKQLAKYMPLSEEMQGAVAADEAIIDASKASSRDGSGIDPDGLEYPEYEEAESEVVEDATESPESEETLFPDDENESNGKDSK